MLQLDSVFQRISSIAIGGHVHPDGDCVGSCLAVYNYLATYYPQIEATVYLESIPEHFAFLANADRIRQAPGEDVPQVDLFLALDCGDESRLGDALAVFRQAKDTLCIDHHLTHVDFAALDVVDAKASSASEMVYLAMDPEKVTKEIAQCLYVGIVHDTGVFQYSCTSPQTMRIAGELMRTGIDYPRIVDETYYVKTYTQQRIRGYALEKSRLTLEGRCIYTVLTREELASYGAVPADLTSIVSTIRSTQGVEVSVFLYETKDGYKISLRSAKYVDVAKIAGMLGGGGHARAAGASSADSPEEILDFLFSRIAEQLI